MPRLVADQVERTRRQAERLANNPLLSKAKELAKLGGSPPARGHKGAVPLH